MTLPLLVRRSLRQHALSTAVTALSLALAGGLLMTVWVLRQQARQTFERTPTPWFQASQWGRAHVAACRQCVRVDSRACLREPDPTRAWSWNRSHPPRGHTSAHRSLQQATQPTATTPQWLPSSASASLAHRYVPNGSRQREVQSSPTQCNVTGHDASCAVRQAATWPFVQDPGGTLGNGKIEMACPSSTVSIARRRLPRTSMK